MFTTILTFFGGLVTKEFIISIFKDVIYELIQEEVDKFVKDTKNPYDNRLNEKFKEFIEDRED